MAAIQLSFSLRTSSNVKTVHLIGSWDGYQGQLPLSKGSKSGSWTGTFRFQPSVLKQGQRYWYYYMMDGYHVSHDPAQQHTVEPTTGRKLNILDVPAGKAKASSGHSSSSSKRASRRYSREVPTGRGVAACDIQSPRPQRPGQTKAIVEAQFQQATLEQIASRLSNTNLDDSSSEEEDSDDDSDVDSDCPSLSSASSRSSCSSADSLTSSCSCERYGITRAGQRVKLDCGGSRCGYSDEECSSESEDERAYAKARATRRHAVLIRA